MQRHLHALKFVCKNAELGCKISDSCKFGIPYERALNHIKKCKAETFLCPFGCIDELTNTTSEIVGEFIDEHLEECENFQIKCNKCEILFKNSMITKHDCFE